MKLHVKKINGDEFTTEVNDGRSLKDIYDELSNTSGSSFILIGKRIVQKPTIDEITEE